MPMWILGEFGPDSLQTLVDMFRGQASELVESARLAVGAGDAERAGRAAPTLMGSAATIGATDLASLCDELEVMARSGSLVGAQPIAAALSPSLAAARRELAAFEVGLAPAQ